MKILIDINLSPEWVSALEEAGHQAVHWAHVGNPSAPDCELMEWAKTRDYVVFTHDLDFGAILATTHADGPSVVQIRTQNIHPLHAKAPLLLMLRQYEDRLLQGALIILDDVRHRVRILPLDLM